MNINNMSNEEIQKMTVEDFIDAASILLSKTDNFDEIYLKGHKTSIKVTKPEEINYMEAE